MSDEEIFNENESKFMHQVENFYTALSFAKVCAQKCNILRPERRSTLNDNEVTCLNLCGYNIEATKKRFYGKVKEVFVNQE